MTLGRDALTQVPPLGDGDLHVWIVPLEHPDKRRRRELAHLAEGMLLASYLGSTPAALEFERGPGGKPRLRGEPLQFNLSHSGGLALVGVSLRLPLGVDVQGPHPTAAKPWFAKRICSPREYRHYGGAPGPQQLLRLWARKEAAIKARGEGSYVAVGDIDVLDDELGDGWLCQDIELPGAAGFHAAVVTREVPGLTVTARAFSWA